MMGRSLAETQAAVSSPEFTVWKAFDELSPIGEDRADLRAGTISALLYNINRKRGTPGRTALDYMYFRDCQGLQAAEPKRQSPQMMASAMMRITAMLGGQLLKRKPDGTTEPIVSLE